MGADKQGSRELDYISFLNLQQIPKQKLWYFLKTI